MGRDIIIYHAKCLDGFTAAWAAWISLPAPTAPNREKVAIPALYGSDPPQVGSDDRIFIVDFSYPRDQLVALRSKVAGILVLDHHKTAQEDLCDFPNAIFDMERSGAMIAWQHFHPTEKPPLLVQYVQDRDLWKFDLDHSQQVNAWLRIMPQNFEAWSDYSYSMEEDLSSIVSAGDTLLAAQKQQVETMCERSRMVVIGGHRVPVANATVHFSEVGDALCHKYPDAPFAAYWLDRGDGWIQWGLRSQGGFDVSEVAKLYGGGGHQAAAGFQIKRASSWPNEKSYGN